MEATLGNNTSLNRESFVVFRNSQGTEARGTLLRLDRHVGAFEVYNPYSILQLSEVLNELKVYMGDRLVYSGNALVTNLVNTGLELLCECKLAESGWQDVEMLSPTAPLDGLREDFASFVKETQKQSQILPEYKVAVADVQNFFLDLRHWLEKVELSIRSSPTGDRIELERKVIASLAGQVLATVDGLFVNFERVSNMVPVELQPLHRAYVIRQLHPYVLAAPFAYRTFKKPLGYAGDYEMVNMILGDPHQGSSLFAKVINYWLLKQPSAEAHRNRVKHLQRKLDEEVRRVARHGRRTRILNLGCGPAGEIQAFLQDNPVSDEADFTLLDFNDETLEYATQCLQGLKDRHSRRTGLSFERRSVNQILKDASRRPGQGPVEQFDMIYCAGLFDYLNNRICLRLMTYFYDMVAPGGLLVATNVDASNPNRHSMDFILEWHLVYRTQGEMAQLAPQQARDSDCHVASDSTGVNLFLEVRKPDAV